MNIYRWICPLLLLCLFAGACRLTQQSQDAANAVRQLDRARVAVFVTILSSLIDKSLNRPF